MQLYFFMFDIYFLFVYYDYLILFLIFQVVIFQLSGALALLSWL
jgi:hypothetical protein